jgi:hypothetical protein
MKKTNFNRSALHGGCVKSPFNFKHWVLGMLAMLFACGAQAVDFSGSGFLTVTAAKKFDSQLPDGFFVSDFGQAGIYNSNKWSLGPDSKLGLQGVMTLNPQWSATGQIVSRGAQDGKVDLEWLYATYQATDSVTVQVGRKRLPLFYYSESQDVGLSMPWVRLPPQAYGWDVVNFDGANLIHHGNLGGWSSTAEMYFGTENRKDNPYQQIYLGQDTHTNEKWTNIVGADWTLSHDWLELRFAVMHSNWVVGGVNYGGQTFYSVAAMADYDNWVIRSEYSVIKRLAANEDDWAVMAGIGRQFGKWLPMVMYSQYHGTYTDGRPNERDSDVALSLRYDLNASSDIKVQYDIFRDKSDAGITSNPSGYYGNSRLFSISYDRVF